MELKLNKSILFSFAIIIILFIGEDEALFVVCVQT